MEKKRYKKPNLVCENFNPETYCKSCGDNITYSGSCDTTGAVFIDSNNNKSYDKGTDEFLYYNTAGESCGFEINYKPTKNGFCFPEGTTRLYNYKCY